MYNVMYLQCHIYVSYQWEVMEIAGGTALSYSSSRFLVKGEEREKERLQNALF